MALEVHGSTVGDLPFLEFQSGDLRKTIGALGWTVGSVSVLPGMLGMLARQQDPTGLVQLEKHLPQGFVLLAPVRQRAR